MFIRPEFRAKYGVSFPLLLENHRRILWNTLWIMATAVGRTSADSVFCIGNSAIWKCITVERVTLTNFVDRLRVSHVDRNFCMRQTKPAKLIKRSNSARLAAKPLVGLRSSSRVIATLFTKNEMYSYLSWQQNVITCKLANSHYLYSSSPRVEWCRNYP